MAKVPSNWDHLPQGDQLEKCYFQMRFYVEKFFEYSGIPPGGTLNGRQAEDFVQDALLAVLDPYRNGYVYDPRRKSSFTTFMTSCVLRTILRNARKADSRKKEKQKQWAE